MAKCWDKYSEEDQEALMGIGYLTASIKCFLDGFMDACGCTGWYRCTAHATVARDDVYFEGGVAARIEDLAGLYLINVTHVNDEKWIRTQALGLGSFPNPGRKTAAKLLNQ